MHVKYKICDILNLEKYLFLYILSTNIDNCPFALPVRRNPQHRSLLTVVSATSAPPFQPLRHQGNICNLGGFIADQTDGSH
jgi:hypothetical protein